MSDLLTMEAIFFLIIASIIDMNALIYIKSKREKLDFIKAVWWVHVFVLCFATEATKVTF